MTRDELSFALIGLNIGIWLMALNTLWANWPSRRPSRRRALRRKQARQSQSTGVA